MTPDDETPWFISFAAHYAITGVVPNRDKTNLRGNRRNSRRLRFIRALMFQHHANSACPHLR